MRHSKRHNTHNNTPRDSTPPQLTLHPLHHTVQHTHKQHGKPINERYNTPPTSTHVVLPPPFSPSTLPLFPSLLLLTCSSRRTSPMSPRADAAWRGGIWQTYVEVVLPGAFMGYLGGSMFNMLSWSGGRIWMRKEERKEVKSMHLSPTTACLHSLPP